LKPAFAITINKSQGQTFEKVGIDLRADVFDHGQLYVAISRGRMFSSIKILLNKNRKFNVAKNIVYGEVFHYLPKTSNNW
jgi:ATP-dependent exoDNAse (exonuclease V) alpha subunit